MNTVDWKYAKLYTNSSANLVNRKKVVTAKLH